MPADGVYPDSDSDMGPGPGPGAGTTPASDPDFEQTLRQLLDRATRSVVAPAGLAARVRASELPRRQGRRRALVIGAAALAASSVILGGLAVEGHLAPGDGLSIITSTDGGPFSRLATGAPANPGSPPAALAPSSPGASAPSATSTPVYPGIPSTGATSFSSAAPVLPDQATIDQITLAFTEAFDSDGNIDDGLAYVQNGLEYHDMTVRFRQRYPGVAGSLKARLEGITMNTDHEASATIVLTHNDPVLGEQWGYEIRRPVKAVRGNGRWLVSSSTYSFLVGTA
ncbi:RodZ family helix-turn-helix domain-containing protein [Parafrankia elaeagni]|uniref:hypothetical protein n=1 Tax=Parafrankia elaeagni TaxID=222534 RepID=UPI0003A8E770|nr:hypothetical protein [Parafrankia elaeagni]